VDDDKLVGIITEHDISGVLSEVLGLESDGTRIEIESLGNKLGKLREIIEVLDDNAAPLLSILSIPRKNKGDWVIVLRVRASDAEKIVRNLKKRDFKVTDVNP
jgi:CBS domain-containing protein